MFASIPFILLLILQGFARQDCAEFLLGNQDLANVPNQARSIKAFDDLIVQFTLIGKDLKNQGSQERTEGNSEEVRTSQIVDRGSRGLQSGFLEIQRSRDGPAA